MTPSFRRDALPLTPFDEAVALVRAEATPLEVEIVEVSVAVGRILAEPVTAPHSVPHFENSMMDGFAVIAADVVGASADRPVALNIVGEVPAGATPDFAVKSGTAARIMTGAPVPEGADTVIPVEWTDPDGEAVRIRRDAAAGNSIRRVGEDMNAGAEVFRTGKRLRPQELGVLASLGIATVSVYRRPTVSVLSTGDELLAPGEALAPGKIHGSNGLTIAGQAAEAGGLVRDFGIARDEPADLARKLEAAAEADVVLTSGGVSVGERDHLQDVLEARGFRRIFWRVEASPGKPLLFGKLGEAFVFGLPGNPVSSMVAFENFARPFLRLLQGDDQPDRPRLRCLAKGRIHGPAPRRHFARVRVESTPDGVFAREVGPHGSGNLRSMAEANGLAILREGVSEVQPGEPVEVLLLSEPDWAGTFAGR
ncbi:MAG: molybdopterin molybdotransferase MoeA [Gemmatimonadota bacterium]|jgi:molybdopterin molybdotransferase|nr:molybdopterin molybdotransferase MoeA [Gemmatimonadota bacterium]MDP6803572.1 molybdopterin molybdotransferase MoeA [Gemmatimonadota bacterium]MDP7032780.1 molybdopterin molybdotransferase MoeA [Gemmatimonadota bacterium]